jgi:hypothetical protein
MYSLNITIVIEMKESSPQKRIRQDELLNVCIHHLFSLV